MYFRFAAALLLVVLVSMAGVRLEKQSLELRRAVSVQYYQTDLLLEMLVRLRLETQQLTAPSQLGERGVSTLRGNELSKAGNTRANATDQPERKRAAAEREKSNESSSDRLPLLRFRHLFNPEGID